jgi:drug/metabolite transporter (DMT)-like permease
VRQAKAAIRVGCHLGFEPPETDGQFRRSGITLPATIASALAYAVSAVLTRRLGTTESGGAMAISATAIYVVAGGATALGLEGIEVAGDAHRSLRFLLLAWSWPGAADAGLLAGCGLIAAGGFFFLAQGYRLAEANRAAPFEYAALPWGILWGYLFFANLPDLATLAGAVVIIGAGLYTLPRRKARLPPTLHATEPVHPE